MSPIGWTAWELTRALSPRGYVRIDVGGVNDYGLTHRVEDDTPAAPWAMNLADVAGRYRYVAFDLDSTKGNAAYDAGRLSLWLNELNIDHLVAVSGPSGGRHVWLSLDEPCSAELVSTIAGLASQLLPSLDVAPLSNAATGCVRPPFTPHRGGGRSEPEGRVDVLLAHTVTAEDVNALRAFFIDAGAEIAPAPVALMKGMAHDSSGHPYLIGAKRPVSSRIQTLLNSAPADDTSRTQGALLAGCARARWRYADILALLESSPALEHARTRASAAGTRVERGRRAAERTLEIAWRLAVYYVAANLIATDGNDAEFTSRSIAVSTAVAACQQRAEATPGRWGMDGASRAHRAAQGRYSHRAVLDAECLYVSQAAATTVEVDVRRLAADTGYGREACRQALIALSTPDNNDPESAWLIRVQAAHGVHGATFRLSDRFSTGAEEPKWSQAVTRPGSLEPDAQRHWWINKLSHDLQPLAHETFAAPHSLGRTAGRVYQQVPVGATVLATELAHASGMSTDQVSRGLRRLCWAGLVERSQSGWMRPRTATLDAVAMQLDVSGYLAARAWRYEIERGVWAWWQAEHTWMQKRHKKRRGRQMPTGVALFTQNDRPDFPRYPRNRSGDPDHGLARELVENGVLSPRKMKAVA